MIRALVLSGALTFGLLCTGCALTSAGQESAWAVYERFQAALERDGIEADYAVFFSNHAYRDIHDASENDRSEIKEMLAYPHYFSVTFEHFEKSTPAGACLTLNGETIQGDLGSLSIEFVDESGYLKMNDANLLYTDSKTDLLTQAKCPEETRV